MSDAHLKALDGIRGFAAILVLFGHTAGELGASRLTPSVVAAKSGVYLFFVLSSFLLTRQFFRARLDSATTIPFLSEYFRRRFLRILPLYYIAVLAHYAVGFVVPGKGCVILNADSVVKSVLLNRGYGHFWTIPIEFIFYFILPGIALVGVALKKWQAALIYAAFTAVSVMVFGEGDYGIAPVAYIFVCGSLLALAYEYGNAPRNSLYRHGLACVSCVAAVSFFSSWPLLQGYGYSYAQVENMAPWWTVVACLLIAGCLWGPAWFRSGFEWSVLRFIGAISFSAYVWHICVYAAVRNVGGSLAAEVQHALAWLIVLVAGWCSYKFLEMPIYRSLWGQRLWDRCVNKWLPEAAISPGKASV